jgi:hypothetical protein
VPLVVAPFLTFAIGVLAALGLPSERVAEERRARAVLWLVIALSLAPNIAYFACTSPDWSIAYLARAARLPSAAMLVLACGAATVAAIGFEAGVRLVHANAGRRAVILAGGAALAALFVGAVSARRLWVVGSTVEFRGGGTMQTLATSWQGLALVMLDALTVAGLVVALGAQSSTVGANQPSRR